MLFAAVVGVGYAGLLWSAPHVPPDRLLMAAVSATSNSGLTHDALAVVLVPLMILALLMVAGRVLPILLLWRMAARSTTRRRWWGEGGQNGLRPGETRNVGRRRRGAMPRGRQDSLVAGVSVGGNVTV
jgi:hypothetical protein